MDKVVVKVANVSKHFGEGEKKVRALKEVDLHAKEGQILMIVGPSGSGKTTLISIIAGTLKPDTGSVNVFQNELENMSEEDITFFRKENVGFIFQRFNLIPTLTVLENVSIPLLLNNAPKEVAEERARHVLEKVGLKGREDEKPQKLSGGQQQRVAIARALVHEPKLVICDEPTAALDAETGNKIMGLISEMVKQPGRLAIIVTHDSRIFKFADKIAKMDDGVCTLE